MRGWAQILSVDGNMSERQCHVYCSATSGQPDKPSLGTRDGNESNRGSSQMDEGASRKRRWFQPCESEADLNTRVRETLDFISLSQRAGMLVQVDAMG